MAKKRIAHLSENSLFEMGDAMVVQNSQLNSLIDEKDEISEGINILKNNNNEIKSLHSEAEDLIDNLLSGLDSNGIRGTDMQELLEGVDEEVSDCCSYTINKTETIATNNSWSSYVDTYNEYAKRKGLQLNLDPYLVSLSEREYKELDDELNVEFSRRTSIINKTDLSFLSIATALQTAKALLFPLVAEKVGYGKSFDNDERFPHDDKCIKGAERIQKDDFKQKQLNRGYEEGEWLEILNRKPIFDTTKGSPNIGINMEGGYHRIHTLGHDPILGWIFGTANILTDTITLDTFQTYLGQRNPIKILPTKVSFIELFRKTIETVKRNKLNLPAAIVAEGIHLKSDIFTKAGLPVPVIETFAPEFAGKLYKNQYDALCFVRDFKVVGISAAISMFIDMIINLTHAMYYNVERDGSRELFEVRTRKILLISNTIASTSNVICSLITHNPSGLDLGGLLITISHLFRDVKFILNIKKEFLEKRIYEKIDKEMELIEKNEDKLFGVEYQNLTKTNFL